MTQAVKGPDGRVHNFPDQATPQQIQAAMRQTYGMKQEAPPPPAPPSNQWQAGTERTPFTAPNITGNRNVDIALEPVTGYLGRQQAAAQSGLEMLTHGAKTLASGDPTGLVGIVPGAAGYLASPVSAALEPVARPINEYVSPLLESAFGTPPEISTPALTSLIPGLGITRLPGAKARAAAPQARPAPTPKAAPEKADLARAAEEAYQASDNAGVILRPDALTKAAHQMRRELASNGFHEMGQKNTATALDVVDKAIADGNITLKGLDSVRKVVKNLADGTSKTDAKFIGKIVKHMDRMVRNLDESDILTGNAEEGVSALFKAREYWSRYAKAEIIDAAVDKAVRRAEKSGSGGNLENTLRQEIDAILNKPSKLRGFSGAEVAAMRRVVKGRGSLHEILRVTSKLSPQGNGLMLALFGGGALATMSPQVLLPAAAGLAAKPLSTAMTRGNIKQLSELVRRGPSKPEPQPQAPQRPLIQYQR